MIKRTLITTLVLVLGYHFILPHLSRNYFWIPGQQRANYLRAQQFGHDACAQRDHCPGDLEPGDW